MLVMSTISKPSQQVDGYVWIEVEVEAGLDSMVVVGMESGERPASRSKMPPTVLE